jgi:hypothetical protein
MVASYANTVNMVASYAKRTISSRTATLCRATDDLGNGHGPERFLFVCAGSVWLKTDLAEGDRS